jgi:hypothetical protein
MICQGFQLLIFLKFINPKLEWFNGAVCIKSLVWVVFQHTLNKRLKFWSSFNFFELLKLDRYVSILNSKVQCFLSVTLVREGTSQHLIEHNAEGPNIALWCVVTFWYLWCLVQWRTNILGKILIHYFALDSRSEVANFQLSQIFVIHEQDILRFEIQVINSLCMGIVNSRQDLLYHWGYLFFSQRLCWDYIIEKATPWLVFSENESSLIFDGPAWNTENIFMFNLCHYI